MQPDLDIHAFVQTALLLSLVGIAACFYLGLHAIATAHKQKFFRMRQERSLQGWRSIFFAVCLAFFAVFLYFAAEPIAYKYFPPTMTLTVTITPSISPSPTLSPTPTLTPTITLTPRESYTPTPTSTPFIPPDVLLRFTSSVTPNPDTAFSEIIFTTKIDKEKRAINPGTTFKNPIPQMYALFSYDKMLTGVQWTALWYRRGNLVYFETIPWDGFTGGYGYSMWQPSNPLEWQPGEYQVQIFVGVDWMTVGSFSITGNPPTPSLTASYTPTIPTKTPRPSRTPRPTPTPRPTRTTTLTKTPRLSPPP